MTLTGRLVPIWDRSEKSARNFATILDSTGDWEASGCSQVKQLKSNYEIPLRTEGTFETGARRVMILIFQGCGLFAWWRAWSSRSGWRVWIAFVPSSALQKQPHLRSRQ